MRSARDSVSLVIGLPVCGDSLETQKPKKMNCSVNEEKERERREEEACQGVFRK